jgi:DNA repair exonuclease SbcCD ATPase subunit
VKYTEIRQHNVGGNKDITIPGGPVVLISGANGTGKTSIVNGISLLFDGGHNPDLIGPHDDRAVVEIDFDNGWRFRRATTVKSYTLEGWTASDVPIKKPAETLKKLVSGLSLNPTGLVDAPQKDRVKFLQAAMPLVFTTLDIAGALGTDSEIVELPSGDLDAQGFNEFRDGYYSKRTDINRSIRDKEGTRNTLIKSLVVDDETDWAAKAAELRAKRDAVNKQSAGISLEAQKIQDAEVSRLKDEAQQKIDAIKAQLQAAIEALNAEARAAVAEQQAPLMSQLAELIELIGQAEERSQQQERAKGSRESIERIGKEERLLAIQAAKLDRVIEKLDKLKRKKLEDLPIPGVEVKNGTIYKDGKNFDTQLNTAQQYVLSFQVAALTLGELQLMTFDKAESLVGKDREEFIEGIKDAGFQVIMTEAVADTPLTLATV